MRTRNNKTKKEFIVRLQKLFGYLLTGLNTEPYIFLFYGDPLVVETITTVLERLMGGYLVKLSNRDVQATTRAVLIRGPYDLDKILELKKKTKVILAFPGARPKLQPELENLVMPFEFGPSSFMLTSEQVDKELSGVLNWAIEGCKLYKKEGL